MMLYTQYFLSYYNKGSALLLEFIRAVFTIHEVPLSSRTSLLVLYRSTPRNFSAMIAVGSVKYNYNSSNDVFALLVLPIVTWRVILIFQSLFQLLNKTRRYSSGEGMSGRRYSSGEGTCRRKYDLEKVVGSWFPRQSVIEM